MRPSDPVATAKIAATADLDTCLSSFRMVPYHASAKRRGVQTIDLYAYNMALAGALLAPLHVAEVVVRNAMHAALSTRFAREDWWDAPTIVLSKRQRDSIGVTHTKLLGKYSKDPKRPNTDDLVAASDFGFWTGFAEDGPQGYSYERELWDHGLKAAFPRLNRTRRQFKLQLDGVRRMRNRVGHHEPLHQDLKRVNDRYRDALLIIGYVSIPLATWMRDRSSVQDLLALKDPGMATTRF